MFSIVIVVLPMLLFAPHLADQLVRGAQRLQSYFAATPEQPAWIGGVPLVGRRLGSAWDRVAEVKDNLHALLEPYTANLEQIMIGVARALADSLLQVILSLVVATMFWIGSDGLVSVLHDALRGVLVGRSQGGHSTSPLGQYAESPTAWSAPPPSRPCC
ncbi:MAG TPA: hypothetical protein VNW89_01665 [Stellaceae bacterium]|nr:hypothetical protein [Stellaceae bacterium]